MKPPLTDAQREKVAASLGLIGALSRKMGWAWRILGDQAESVAYLALIEAVRDHNQDKAPWGVHASIRVANRVTEAARREQRLQARGERATRLYQRVVSRFDPPVDLDAPERRERLRGLLRTLSAAQQFVYRRFYLEGATWTEICREIGVTRARVYQIRDKMLQRLRDGLTEAFAP
jgi:RNA polymerase sigma factor (sigma-70 family)